MYLKNYTSKSATSDSIARIEGVLLQCGANAIEKEYDADNNRGLVPRISAITFRIRVEAGGPSIQIRLPANAAAAAEVIWRNYAGDRISKDGQTCRGKSKTRSDFINQGERTAWRLIQEWIEVQMSLIAMKQAELLQVFMPYAWDETRKITYFESMKAQKFAALLPAPPTE